MAFESVNSHGKFYMFFLTNLFESTLSSIHEHISCLYSPIERQQKCIGRSSLHAFANNITNLSGQEVLFRITCISSLNYRDVDMKIYNCQK